MSEIIENTTTYAGGGVDSGLVSEELKKTLDFLKNRSGVTSVNGNTGAVNIDTGPKAEDIKTIVLDIFFPVGSAYISANSSFNPNTSWGGTWVKIENKFLLASGTRSIGETGGEEEHTLTTSEMPSHSHGASTDSRGSHYHYNGLSVDTDVLSIYGTSTVGSGKASVHIAGGAPGTKTAHTDSDGSHSHTVSIANTGGGLAHNNMPPYEVVNIWKRTA